MILFFLTIMRVGKKDFLLLLLLLLLITSLFFIISSKKVSACKPSGEDQTCSSNSDCCSGNCYQGLTSSYCVGSYCGDNTCDSGETSSNCCLDCGCPSGQSCKLSGGSYSCVASFSPNGVCEYGAGEQIGDSFYYGVDDCDQVKFF